jgi:hypothetical protein
MMGALGVMLAKAFGRRWAGDLDLVQDIRRGDGADRGVAHFRGHTKFAGRFWFLITAITALLYLAFILFFVGLVILLVQDNKKLGLGVLGFNATIGAIFGILILDNLLSKYMPQLKLLLPY